MIEEWRDIKGYEGLYQISNLGRVKSLNRVVICSNGTSHKIKEKILKNGYMTSGYLFVVLRKDDKSKNHSIHRLVAKAFIPNPKNCTDVNHIDGNKQNNCLYNLEWCTRSENLKHAVNIGLVKNQCKICRSVICKTYNKTLKFDTMKDCSNYFGFKKGWLQNKIRKYGLKFKYKDYFIEVEERG